MTGTPPPKMFISYSWTSLDHEEWVLQLATELRECGVDVILDKWDLKEGQDAFAFMEGMVTDPTITKVALVSDQQYAAKADQRSGGVGTETQIISPAVYEKADQQKFVAVVRELGEDGKAILPTYFKSRKYIDFSDDSAYSDSFEQLLRWAHDRPLHSKPSLGKIPGYLEGREGASLGTGARARRALELIRSGRDNWEGAVSEYFSEFSENLDRFRLGQRPDDEQLIVNLESLVPVRNEAVEVFWALGRYKPQASVLLIRFLEDLLPYHNRPPGVSNWTPRDSENFSFLAHELFLYLVALMLKLERFELVADLLVHRYYIRDNDHAEGGYTTSFEKFYQHSELLELRDKRLRLGRASLHADFLKDRSSGFGLDFQYLQQADFVLFLRDSQDRLRGTNERQAWWPLTAVHLSRWQKAFEVFARCESRAYFDRFGQVLDIPHKHGLGKLIEAYGDKTLSLPRWHYTSLDVARLIAFEAICTRP